jgi:hypothetical protein
MENEKNFKGRKSGGFQAKRLTAKKWEREDERGAQGKKVVTP